MISESEYYNRRTWFRKWFCRAYFYLKWPNWYGNHFSAPSCAVLHPSSPFRSKPATISAQPPLSPSPFATTAQRQVPRSASLPAIFRVLRRCRSTHQVCSPFLSFLLCETETSSRDGCEKFFVEEWLHGACLGAKVMKGIEGPKILHCLKLNSERF